jgi:hypothetical protein
MREQLRQDISTRVDDLLAEDRLHRALPGVSLAMRS